MRKQITIFDITNIFLISALNLIILYPFYYIILNSLNPDLNKGPAFLTINSLITRNYEIVLSNKTLSGAFFVTLARTLLGMVLVILNCALCAFALRKKNIKLRKLYLILFTIPMFFSGGLIPTYLNFKMLNLIDRFLVYIVPHLFDFFYVIILMSCFNDLPDSLEESVKIDGGNYFTILFRIYIPLSKPVLATLALFTAVAQWNAWFDTVYFTRSKSLLTLPAILLRIIKENDVSQEITSYTIGNLVYQINAEGLKFATMVISIIPFLFIYPFLQRYFIKGVMIGSIKG